MSGDGLPLVWLVEDHAVLGENMARLLRRRGQVDVGEIFPSAEDALAALRSENGVHRPSLVIIDLSLPGMNGIDLVHALQRDAPDVLCLMLSGHREQVYVREARAAGARGYVFKDETDVLCEAVRLLLDGGEYFDKP
jgi:DNA-binding NarL/FixJ family response regulator